MIELMASGLVAGLAATAVMDAANLVVARTGFLQPINHQMIGRITGAWIRGRFAHASPDEIPGFSADRLWGFVAHYLIGGVLAVAYLLGWMVLVGGAVSLPWTVVYGVATTVFAYFVMFPSLGLGPVGLRSPHGLKLPLTSLVNHLFYGLGLAGVLALLRI